MVSDAVIRGILLDEETPAAAASTLIGRANEAGGRDNVTALVIRVEPPTRGAATSVACLPSRFDVRAAGNPGPCETCSTAVLRRQ